MEHLDITGASVPISIQDWMKLACNLPSRSSFVASAVNLAWMLTKHLCQIIDSSAEVKLEDHITAENIIIYVERPLLTLHSVGYAPLITHVKFQFEVTGVISLLHAKSSKPSSYPRPRAVCVALGIILLEIFSRGNSSSPETSSGKANNGNSDYTSQNNHPAALPPMRKRQASVSMNSGSISTMAKNLLILLGMPLSICQLVCDLLESRNEPCSNSAFTSLEDILDVGNESCSNLALASVEEALWDLSHMKSIPQLFLFDRTCPQRALGETYLFGNTDTHLIGREREINSLMTAKNNVSAHVHMKNNTNDSGRNFMCEAAFLSGYAGSGKSSLLHSLIRACNEDQWFVLGCKFDKRSAPHMVMAKAFDNFFGKWGTINNDMHSDLNPSMIQSFNKICSRIFATMDNEGLHQLCDLVPNVAKIFPLLAYPRSNNQDDDGISSMDKVGSAKKRLQNLFNVLFKSLCSAGRPVLFTFDDLQWSESFMMDSMTDFVVNYIPDSSEVSGEICRRGLLIAGTFRSNEVKESDDLIQRINLMKESGRANVTMVTVGEMSKVDVTKLVSLKLCLPWRYTKELAGLVHSKTRGNPFFVVQFLRSIIQNKMLSFSVKSRRWTWDCDVVDMQMMSDGVAELLTTTFNQLSSTLMRTVKMLSCLGSQVEESTINALSRNEVLSFNMQNELSLAVKEGIMEKAGPVYQFTHDIIQQTIYELIPSHHRKLLHKAIGKDLLKSAVNDHTMHLLATDQINIFCKDGDPSLEECSQFAHSNATAAKFAIASSSFEQARSYIDIGMQLLETQYWETQYSLSLDLFEMSASVSCMHGDITKMSTCLDEISSHARTFDDSLKASSLLVKLLASSSKFEEARSNCLIILSNLGEVFPSEINLPLVLNELSLIQRALRDITSNQIKLLPPMTDRNKLNAMKFLNMLCMYSNISKPMLLPLLSCRMVRLTMEYGFCDDSIVGLAIVGLSMYHFTDDIQLANRIGKVSESLVEESPKKHALRSRLCKELVTVLKMITEPFQSVLPLYPELYNSAMLVGDVENAMICRGNYCGVSFWVGVSDLFSVSKHLVICIKEAAKYQQNTVLYEAMTNLNACSYLSGRTYVEVDVKSFDELNSIAEKTNSASLLWQTFVHQMALKFWMREYKDVVELSEKYDEKHTSSQQKRALDVIRTLFEGVAYLSLARDTKRAKWKIRGEKALKWMSQLASMSKWNWENKSSLLQAELHYLEGNFESAETFYKASIKAAHEHKFIHEEALACELYGIFCVENKMGDKGSKQLRIALDKYKRWGATKKANKLQLFIDRVDSCYLRSLKIS